MSPPPAALQPLFTFAYQDPVLLQDSRVFRNMLDIEEFYLAASNYFQVSASIDQDYSTYSSIPRLFSKRSSPTCGRSSPAGCWR